jgi:ABC-type dipeptide/oligopeptide/nickel transport system permease subunit
MSTYTEVAVAGQRTLGWPRFLRSPQGIAGLVILVLVLGVAFIGPLVAPYSLAQPIGIPGSPPGNGALLGTDYLGRDVLSRVLHGGIPVIELSIVTIALTYLIGITIGMIAGLVRSMVDPMMMRAVDIVLVFPPLLLVLLLIAGGGSGFWVLVIAIVLVLFPGVARIVRTATLEVSTTSYIEAAVARGERMVPIMRREILPNIMPPVLADLGVRFAGAIILAASVNFLGLGAQPPAANWALMVAENREIISVNIWSVVVPAVLLALLTISVNLLGDAYVRSMGGSSGAGNDR